MKPFQRLDLTSSAPYPPREYFRKALWGIVRPTIFRWSPRSMLRFRVWLVNLFGGHLHPTAVLRPSAVIWHPWLLWMDAFSCLADDVLLYNLGPVHIGAHTVLSQRVHVCNGSHDISRVELPLTRPTCRIGAGVWVCAEAFLGPGCTIGDNAIVGARAVVTKEVTEGMIVAGNPARPVRQRPVPSNLDQD
jgi:putative colanic acid biosynthesis acetyltransferase WcaF